MLRSFLPLALCVTALAGTDRYARSTAGNFTVDLAGTPDTRPRTWGTQGYVVWPVKFNVLAGDRVRVLRVYGDFLIWPKGKPPAGTHAGALLSLHTSSPDTPVNSVSPYFADNCFLYVQLATGGEPERASFDRDVSAGGLLAKDNVLYVKVAVWLNNTGLEIHMEPTWVMVYRIEDAQGNPVALRVGANSRTRGRTSNPRADGSAQRQ